MTMSALPPKLQGEDKWVSTDWDNWLQRPLLKIKHWFAFGPRATEWWARWRELPKILFAVKGRGAWRWEYTDGTRRDIEDYSDNILRDKSLLKSNYYLSAIQYWSRWHFAVQWPLHVTFHVYLKDSDVPAFNRYPGNTVDGKLLYIRFGARRDADRVYWFPSLFIGLTWN